MLDHVPHGFGVDFVGRRLDLEAPLVERHAAVVEPRVSQHLLQADAARLVRVQQPAQQVLAVCGRIKQSRYSKDELPLSIICMKTI